MSSNTSLSDDQTTDDSIDTEYFTASSQSGSTVDDTSSDVKGIVIVWNSKILPYDGSGEMISKKCTSCEQNVDDSITTDNKEAINVDDLSRILSYITSTKEAVIFNSDTLSRIVSFLPSNDIQSLALICRRLGVREEGELSLIELHDKALFKQPPPLYEDCLICKLRMPTLLSGSVYMTCCGKLVCSGCYYSSIHDNQGNIVVDNKKCPFCRAPHHLTHIERLQKRAPASQDYTKAFELYHRAAELGHAKAYANVGYAYSNGKGVEVDRKKAKHYYEHAAMRGEKVARNNLGIIEKKAGNMDRALKHYLIAVEDGNSKSLTNIKRLYKSGQATEDEYTKALQSYQAYLGEIKSDQRDRAAAANDKYRYY